MGLNNKQRIERQRWLDAQLAQEEQLLAEWEAAEFSEWLLDILRDEIAEIRAAGPEDMRAIVALIETNMRRMEVAMSEYTG